MKPAPFRYAAPTEIDEVVALLAEHGGEAKPIAGGQSLVPMMNLRLARPEILVDINRVPELTGVSVDAGGLRIGATTRQLEIERSAQVRSDVPLLADAMWWIGHVPTRARGTIAGSIVHADPAAELPAVLTALGGELVVSSARGERSIPADDLFEGTFTTSVADDELATEVRFPLDGATQRAAFAEVARRHGDFALVGAAVSLTLDADGAVGDAAIVLCGVADVPRRIADAAQLVIGHRPEDVSGSELAAAVSASVDPRGNLHADGAYRKRVAGVVASRAFARATGLDPEGSAR